MQMIAFKMKLKAGNEEEYFRRHQEIWPALKDLLTKNGIYDYAIFLDPETLDLFAVQKQQGNYDQDELKNSAVMKEWWLYMRDLMDTNMDNSPVSLPLKQVFYLP